MFSIYISFGSPFFVASMSSSLGMLSEGWRPFMIVHMSSAGTCFFVLMNIAKRSSINLHRVVAPFMRALDRSSVSFPLRFAPIR